MGWGLRTGVRSGTGRGFGVLCFVLVTPWLSAAEPPAPDAQSFSEAPQALYTRASAPRVPHGTDVDLIEVHETYSFEEDGNYVYTRYFLYKVLTDGGASRCDSLSINWSPWRDEKPTMKARVIRADGSVYSLDQATITDSPAQVKHSALYSDERTLRAPLPAIAPGAVVEAELSMHEKPPLAGVGMVARRYLQLSDPVEHIRLTLQAPKSLSLHYRVDLLPGLAPKHSEEAGLDRWVFDSGPAPAAQASVPGLPSEVYAWPAVTFSTSASWRDLAQAYSHVVDSKLAAGEVKELVARLTKGRASREAKIDAIVDYLNREIRYTGIEFDRASVLPHSPAETLLHKYGDCKDKSLLLVGMLRAAGVEANLALLNAADRLDVPAELPGMGLFDHAIVRVSGEPALWIDATDDSARPGQLPDMDRGRLALVVDPETTALTRVDEPRSADNVMYEEREIRLADQGPARVLEVTRPRGNFESDYRRQYAGLANKATQDFLTDYFKREYIAERVDRLERSDPRDFSQPFRLTLEGKAARRAETGLSEAAAYIRLDGLFTSLPRDLRTRELTDEENAKTTRAAKKRTDDYQLPRPFIAEWHYRIVPPSGFESAALPSDASLKLGPATLEERFSRDAAGVVHADLRFDTIQRRFNPAEQTELRNKIAELVEGDAIRIKFDLRAHSLLAQGHAREAFQVYRDLVTQHPNDPVQHLRRADGLLIAGMGEAARKEAEVATRLDPKSAFAQQTLAHILQHDLIGRWHAPGADYAAAAAAYRAAIALAPQDKTLVVNYAMLLEHDSQWVRYGPGADLKGAIAEYRKLTPQQLGNIGFPQNLSYALFYSRDFEGGLQVANTLKEPPLPVLLACEAELQGASHALDEARRRTYGEEKFKQAVSTAGQMLLVVRDYPKAATMLETGASGPSMARTMGIVSLLRQARHHEDLQFGNSPEDVVRRMLVASLSGPTSLHDLEVFESRNALAYQASLSADERGEVMQKFRSDNPAKQTELPRDVLLDLSLSAMQVKSSGDDTVGYRATVQILGRNQSFVVVKEDGEYKILDSTSTPTALALEVLDRVKRTDLAGAGTLLNWVREALPNESGDDPYNSDPLLRLWAPRQHEADARTITIAAAAILAQRHHSARRGVSLLEEAKGAADKSEREGIDVALLKGYELLGEQERVLEIAASLAGRSPRSQRAFAARWCALLMLHRFQEAEELAKERLNEIPGDMAALRALATTPAAQHNYATAYERTLKVVANASSDAQDLNQAAWFTLFYDRPGGVDLEAALRALQMRANDREFLHTLGCIYAEIGKPREARDVLVQAMDSRNLTQPDSDLWYAFGRIAEDYGERDIALADYAKVTPPKMTESEWDSTYRLAQSRLRFLGAPAAPAKGQRSAR
jgi:Flp pilus assembly protein TadD